MAALVADQRAAADERTAVDDYMVHNPMMLDRRFLDLLENPAIVGALDTFLGPTSILYAYTSSSMPAGGSNYSRRVHVDSPRVIPGYMTNLGVIVALDDFTDDNGATYFLPRSFERTDPPSEEEFFAGAQRVYPDARRSGRLQRTHVPLRRCQRHRSRSSRRHDELVQGVHASAVRLPANGR